VSLVSLQNVRSGGRTNAAAEPFIIKGESHTKSNGADAMIGAVAGVGKARSLVPGSVRLRALEWRQPRARSLPRWNRRRC
jgi:hypothetical protein